MPANLNALIRYKTIDQCLRNKLSYWTIDKLQEKCREACGEYRGLYKKISERTIRDDIRVMRSEILGFNAPITCKSGCYEYGDPHYSIFDVPLRTMDVIEKTRTFLIENKDLFESSEVGEIIEELANVNQGSIVAEIRFCFSPKHHALSQRNGDPKTANEKREASHRRDSRDSEPERFDICWGRIFDLL